MQPCDAPLLVRHVLGKDADPLAALESPIYGSAEINATVPPSTNPMHPAALPPADLLKQTQELHTRRSGPGGQRRNKPQTAVVLLHKPTGISAEANERRSQAENRQVALQLPYRAIWRPCALPGARWAAPPTRRYTARTRLQQRTAPGREANRSVSALQ